MVYFFTSSWTIIILATVTSELILHWPDITVTHTQVHLTSNQPTLKTYHFSTCNNSQQIDRLEIKLSTHLANVSESIMKCVRNSFFSYNHVKNWRSFQLSTQLQHKSSHIWWKILVFFVFLLQLWSGIVILPLFF